MSKPQRPLPQPSNLTAPHWDGARQHKLMVQKCDDCAGYTFIPRPVCHHCFSPNLKWVESSGKGTVYSYTIVHRPPDPSFEAPFCIAIIELEEGWHMTSNIVGSPVEEIRTGLPVEVEFLDVGEMTLPAFKLSGA